jgi:chemotaxis signal transduction protein
MNQPTNAPRDLLEQRARRLAQPLESVERGAPDGGARSALLVVRVGDERLGVSLDHITEVRAVGRLTPIPGAQPPIVGVVAWRGRVLTVLDVARSRQEQIVVTDSTRILVIGQRRASFGVIVDDVDDVEDVNLHDAVAVEDVAPARREFVRGVTADAIVVLDAAALIARFAPTH